MKTVEITTAKGSLAEYTRRAAGTPLILTSRGKPVVAMVDIRGTDQESLSLSTNPRFLAILKDSRERLEQEGGISIEEMRRRLGIPRRNRKGRTVHPKSRLSPRRSKAKRRVTRNGMQSGGKARRG